MPESLINTKRRINTIKSTEKITKAMKLVASVKYQRWRKYYEDNKPYAGGLKSVLDEVLSHTDFKSLEDSSYFKEREGKKALYIVFTSILGLCGAYNYSLFKTLDPLLKPGDEIIAIGQKALIHYKDKEYTLVEDFASLMDNYSYSKVRRLRHVIFQKYQTGEYSSINLVYTHYKNSMTFLPTVEKIAPLDITSFQEEKNGYGFEPIYESSKEEVINMLIPHYLDSLLYNRFIESELSELASRRNAMEAATDSADKIVSQLTIQYNKSRQNAITQEITEVVAGATAGKKEE